MLVEPTFIKLDETTDYLLNLVAKANGRTPIMEKIETGIYRISHWNSEDLISNVIDFKEPLENITDHDWMMDYGVCDNYTQILDQCSTIKEDPERKFCIFLVLIEKDKQSPEGGWRWHKWGEYIGNQEPKCEYLYDEPVITQVYTYKIHELE